MLDERVLAHTCSAQCPLLRRLLLSQSVCEGGEWTGAALFQVCVHARMYVCVCVCVCVYARMLMWGGVLAAHTFISCTAMSVG